MKLWWVEDEDALRTLIGQCFLDELKINYQIVKSFNECLPSTIEMEDFIKHFTLSVP